MVGAHPDAHRAHLQSCMTHALARLTVLGTGSTLDDGIFGDPDVNATLGHILSAWLVTPVACSCVLTMALLSSLTCCHPPDVM